MEERERLTAFFERYAAHLEAWCQSVHFPPTREREARSRAASGRPWVDRLALRPDPSLVSEIMRGILEDLSSSTGEHSPDLGKWREMTESDDSLSAELLQTVLSGDATRADRFADAAGLPAPLLRLLGAYLARPFLASAVRGFDDSCVDVNRTTAECPACGCLAALAFLMPESGQRRLWCRHCGTDWPVLRLKCPSCGNTESRTLGYFQLEDQTGRRVDFCRRCGCYLKTIDLRVVGGGKPSDRADFEDLSSEELDVAAVQEGFVSADRTGTSTGRLRAE